MASEDYGNYFELDYYAGNCENLGNKTPGPAGPPSLLKRAGV